jgi:hypothetical protein
MTQLIVKPGDYVFNTHTNELVRVRVNTFINFTGEPHIKKIEPDSGMCWYGNMFLGAIVHNN